MKVSISAVLITALLGSGAVQASTTNWYVGGKAGWSKFHNVDMEPAFKYGGEEADSDDVSFGAFMGYQFHKNVAVELGYDWLGQYKKESVWSESKVSAQMLQATVRLSAPMNTELEVYTRLGGAMTWTEHKLSSIVGSASHDENKAAFVGALGMQYAIDNNWSARIEYQYVTKLGDSDVENGGVSMSNSTVSMGMLYRF